MARIQIPDPGAAAHPAKNEGAVPGLPNQSGNHSERTHMVSTATPENEVNGYRSPVGAAMEAYDLALPEDSEHSACHGASMEAAVNTALQVALDGRVVYDPRELNRLISTVVAAHLRARADQHMAFAEDAGRTAFEREWHASEAVELDALADRVQAGGEAA
jgi:hypothetical protein